MNHSNIKCLLVLFTAITLISCQPEKVRTEFSQEQVRSIEELMKAANIPGLQIGYFTGNEESIYAGGFTNRSTGEKINETTLFRANDLGYGVITAICFRLAEENQLDLNQPVSEDYQDPRLENGTYNHLITYNHLLSHTSGLPIWAGPNESIEIITVPGETWNYSHLGFEWITKALESKFGSSIHDLASQWVFQPLDMQNSFFGTKSGGNVATGHDLIGRNRTPGITNSSTFFTNVRDYLKLLNAFSENFFQEDSKSAQSQTLAKVSIWEDETEPSLVTWGPGMGIQSGAEGQALWQYSDEQTMKSFAVVYPESNIGWVILTNSENGLSISKALAKLFFSHELAALDWLNFETYKSPGWQTRRTLESAFAFGDSLDARDTYKQLLTNEPDELNDALLNNIIWSFFERNELDAALRLARLHIEHFPNTASTYVRLGEALAFQSKYAQSWATYQKAMQLDPESSRQIMPRFPWHVEATQAMQESQELPLGLLTGSFANSTVEIENDQLIYSDEAYEKIPLRRIGNSLFDVEAAATFRIRFILENGQVVRLEKSHLNGDRTSEPKKSI